MTCEICQQIEKKIGVLIETKEVVALIAPKPAVTGHVLVVPREHHAILEQVPDAVVGQMMTVANRLSIVLFEGLGCQGTNMIVPNGIPAGQSAPHTAMHIIPRNENDEVNVLWKPKQLNEEEMSAIELKMKEEASKMGKKEEPAPKKEAPKQEVLQLSDEENYLLKSLKRIP
ncbi:MAG: HIT family protein [Nanoarchaeota archaeon]